MIEHVTPTSARRWRLGLGVVLVLAVASLTPAEQGSAESTDAAATGVTIAVRLGPGRLGTFRTTGAVQDRGQLTATRTVSSGRLRMNMTLRGGRGTLVITSTRACASGKGRWTVGAGTGSYEGATGGGTAKGPVGCKRPWTASTVIHTGALVLLPPALTPAGAYGGWTPQDEYLAFEVAPSGRNVVGLEVSGFSWNCVSENGRFSLSSTPDRMPGPFPIADDRTFAVQMFSNVALSGRFTPRGAEGTIVIGEYAFTDAYGKPATCGGTVPWSAATPPPPPRRALRGTYCGRTAAGHGICLDVVDGGRELRNLRVTARLNCGDLWFDLQLTLDDLVALGPTLKFEYRYSQPIPGGEPVVANLRGSFDQSGTSTGSLVLARPSFTFEGTRYTCSGGGASWTAQLQR